MPHDGVRNAMAKFNNLIAAHYQRGEDEATSAATNRATLTAGGVDDDGRSAISAAVTERQASHHHIYTNYEASSHSLAATQFTQDDDAFGYDYDPLPLSFKSNLLPRSESLFYLGAGRTASVASDETVVPDAMAQNPPHDATNRPNWQAHARESGRAGNCYAHTLDAKHLRDRLFFSASLMPPDTGLQAGTDQALQEVHAIRLESTLLQQSIIYHEHGLDNLRERVAIARARLAQLEAGNLAMETALQSSK